MKFKTNYRKLRNDLPLMGEQELNAWLEELLDNTSVVDIKTISKTLNARIEEDYYHLLFKRETKMCDKCNVVYPGTVVTCPKCGNDRLRAFKITDNLDEVLKI